ncbi:heavy-metal-associated domain-containing protein [Thiomicrospira cyclica]|uniref:Heavy metal transport/detoxification protein n=1 Tax=Thiomicrospira cyclica (strain DSM 14477 / JCM 11371 / ALM1) TaxID=717773 RepID=F6DBZ8_THICA|nr:heavy-metal-associated domain-containing protein [Thiomicrospira cyclica]AEG31384.1 Heavy metal transport/detoxification protein [Thiomicrospira cyclica ALM1]
MEYVHNIMNLKCSGCVNQVTKKLQGIEGVSDVRVDLELGLVRYQATGLGINEQVLTQLIKLGYPEVGSVDGIAAAGAKAKSFVSCAIGKMTKE